jgi:hypothetical protein
LERPTCPSDGGLIKDKVNNSHDQSICQQKRPLPNTESSPPPSYHRVAAAMMVASVVPPSLAGSALARPAAAFVRTRLLFPGDALSGSASRPASGCSVVRGGGAGRPLISFAAGGGTGEEPFFFVPLCAKSHMHWGLFN